MADQDELIRDDDGGGDNSNKRRRQRSRSAELRDDGMYWKLVKRGSNSPAYLSTRTYRTAKEKAFFITTG